MLIYAAKADWPVISITKIAICSDIQYTILIMCANTKLKTGNKPKKVATSTAATFIRTRINYRLITNLSCSVPLEVERTAIYTPFDKLSVGS